MSVQQVIPWALLVLILVGIAVLVKLFQVIGQVSVRLDEMKGILDAKNKELSGTIVRLESIVVTTEKLMQEEIGPTLNVARQTLSNVETVTQTLASTVLTAQRMVGKADSLLEVGKIAVLSGTAFKLVAGKSAGLAGGLLSGIGTGIRFAFSRRARPEPKKPLPAAKKNGIGPKTRPDRNELLPAEEPKMVPAKGKR